MAGELREIRYVLTPDGYEPSPEMLAEQKTAPAEVTEQAYLSRLDEINETFQVLKDGHHSLEIALVNSHAAGDQLVLFVSTSLSSLTQNPGNAIELAYRAAANPNTAYLYAAFPGNGRSSGFGPSEQLHRARAGRFTKTEGGVYVPLPTVQKAANMLTKASLVPQHISGDESGGRLGMAMMAAFDAGAIKDAYFNGIPGVAAGANYTTEMLSEDVKSRIERRRREDSRPGDITPDRIDEAKARLPRIYKGLDQKLANITSFMPRGWLYNGPATLAQFSRFNHQNLGDPLQHAAVQDALAALARQEAMISFQFNQASRLHGDRQACVEFGRQIMNLIPDEAQSPGRGVRILFGEGGLDEHTNEPEARTRAERHALGSIIRFLVAIPGHRHKPEPVATPTKVAA